jgi:RES domain-containing protein
VTGNALVWRITRSVHAANPLSGEGAARAGNRWNSIGVRVGYTSTSRPLAVLEMLVHVTREGIPEDVVFIPIDVPASLIDELETPPENWNALPYSDQSRHAGDKWAREKKSAALLVPSVVLPAERNLLINPLHPQFSKVKIHAPELHAIDRRLLR